MKKKLMMTMVITSSLLMISTWSLRPMSSDSSLYFSISSLVSRIFFLRTSRRLDPWGWVILLLVVLVVEMYVTLEGADG